MAEHKSQQELESLERQLIELEKIAGADSAVEGEIERLKQQVSELRKELLAHLSAWQRVQLARHPLRPYTLDYIELLFRTSRNCTATADSRTTRPSSAAWRCFTTSR